MKKLKKLLGLVLALAMVMGISVTAFAASGSESITITGVASENHTFTAYQIFAGTSSGNTLSNVTWGDGVDSTALVTALKNNSTLSTYFTASTYTAEEVAEVLAANNDKAAFANAFSIVVAANVSSTASGTRESATEESGGTYSYTISGLAEGYYIVVDSSTSTGTDQDAVSGYIIKVVAGTTNEIATKAVVPDTSKEVLQDDNGTTSDESDDTYGDYNTGSIGDTVSFKVTSHVPNVSGYTKYYFNVIDTLSKGLTFNNDVVIKIGGVTLDTSSYTVTPITNSDDSTTVTIVFKDAVNLLANYTVGTEITITYSATINEDADMTTNGNTNEVYAIYSNNPTATPVGTGDTPDPEDPVGETPKQTTTTYVTGIQITKVDNDNTSTTLTGAKFSISGTALNVVYVNSEIFKEDTSGTYYRLTDGTYTETAPTTETADSYESTSTMYSKVTEVTKTTDTTDFVAEGYVDDNGVLTFEGLGEGTYYIEELIAPDGYNLLSDKITVIIAMDTEGTWSVTTGSGDTLTKNTNGLYELQVKNKSGSSLPSTGGIGTTIFYIVGGVLVLGAVVLLITRRRMRRA